MTYPGIDTDAAVIQKSVMFIAVAAAVQEDDLAVSELVGSEPRKYLPDYGGNSLGLLFLLDLLLVLL